MENLYLEYVSERELYHSYMPFLKQGGLFVRTTEPYDLGIEVQLEITLPDSLESSKVKGTVCWLTPVGAQNGTPAGIGISFDDDPDQVRNQIEKSLGRYLNSADPTLTM
jgi:type IV pilus assembly protein PilZ